MDLKCGYSLWFYQIQEGNCTCNFFGDDPCVIGKKKLEMYALENIAVKWGMVFMSCIMKYYMHCGYE